ncbi:homospermidine synthase [Actinopolyspora xinjiangensis]|uniref:Homospermidine synthase n=2 Tax=Actinopolyspora xinjiangensis TaxID=405564 RepID=A0A1H0W1Y6_9ACTN|nr:homospermidine synthase [Actinopolyspora xinjiangensis]
MLLLGCGAVSRCLQPLLLRHIDMDFRRLTIMDKLDSRAHAEGALARGARFVRHRITRWNYPNTLAEQLGEGDVLINLTWDVDSLDLLRWCHSHGVRYLDTSLEMWPSENDSTTSAADRTTYRRHGELYELAARLDPAGPTAVVEHGANPGLVSHLAKRALHDVATAMLDDRSAGAEPRPDGADELESALAEADYARIAMASGTKAVHISERDTQRGSVPKRVGEFVNTWSVKGFQEEATAPAELGWGTHERCLPPRAVTHGSGPGNQIYLARTGMSTWVRSWVPTTGPMLGMMISHGETYTIGERLTVRDDEGEPVYRPTVLFAYLPSDPALASLHEFRMAGYRTQSERRIMDDEIVGGADELGVLLLGHGRGGWWTGSRLDIHRARSLAPGQNATTLQVAAAVLGGLRWMLFHPNRGLCVPDDLDHDEVLAAAEPYLGDCPSVPTGWTPLDGPDDRLDAPPWEPDEDPWQFTSVLVR